jgi:hypothetical protein
MNNLIKIASIVVYIFFAQVYPIVHWHPDDHHNDIGLHMSEHSPELPLNDHHHDDHPGHTDELEHGDCFFVSSQDYTIASSTSTLKLITQTYITKNFIDPDSQILNHKPKEVPLNLAKHNLPDILPNRAPPIS